MALHKKQGSHHHQGSASGSHKSYLIKVYEAHIGRALTLALLKQLCHTYTRYETLDGN